MSLSGEVSCRSRGHEGGTASGQRGGAAEQVAEPPRLDTKGKGKEETLCGGGCQRMYAVLHGDCVVRLAWRTLLWPVERRGDDEELSVMSTIPARLTYLSVAPPPPLQVSV